MEIGLGSSKRLALFAGMIALTTVTNLIIVPMPQPLAEYDLSPVMIYALGVLMGPLSGLIIGLAQGIGTFYKAVVFGWPMLFVPGAMLVRGAEATIIGAIARIRKRPERNYLSKIEIAAMVIGVIWETLAFFAIDYFLFGLGFAILTLGTIVDAVFIPVAMALVIFIRRRLGLRMLM
jgi:uncharacterized membrane protein